MKYTNENRLRSAGNSNSETEFMMFLIPLFEKSNFNLRVVYFIFYVSGSQVTQLGQSRIIKNKTTFQKQQHKER